MVGTSVSQTLDYKMFSFKNFAIKRIHKRFDAQIAKFEKKNHRKPLVTELRKIQLLSIPERIWFSLVGSAFLYFSLIAATNSVWLLVFAFGPLSIYILYRGLFGRFLDVSSIASDEGLSLDDATSERVIRQHLAGIENTHFYALLLIDASLSILLIVLEVLAAIFGAFAAIAG